MDNRTLLEKADLALSDLTGTAGAMVPAQAKKFIRLLIRQSEILGMAQVKPMASFKQRLEKVRFGSRILRAGTEATALSAGDRSKVDLSQVELDAQLFKAQVDLNNEVLEDSIEQRMLLQTTMDIMGDAVSRDMDEVIINGDTSSGDTFLAKFDGMLAAATSNVVALGPTSLDTPVLKAMLKTMPKEFIRNKKKLRYLTAMDAETDYRDTLSERATVAGDKFLLNDAPVMYSGVPIQDVPMFPEDLNLHGGSNETNVILTDPKNICVGVWRKIQVETDKDVESGVLKVVTTMRFDFKYVHEPAVVKATGITLS